MAERVPAAVFPPGEFVKDELEARGWSQVELAEILGRPPRLVSEIISGKRAITPETARGLAEAFGTDPQLWMNLEASYQLGRMAPRDDVVRRRARLYELLPMKEMMRRGWIEQTDSIDVLEQRAREYLGCDSLDALEGQMTFDAAARAPVAAPTPGQCAWLTRARQVARLAHAESYDPANLNAALARIRALLASAEEVRHAPRILAEAGIRVIAVETLPQTRIDGACFWLDAHSPVVALSLRFDRIDAFWFTMMHELGHVRNGDGKGDDPPIDVDLVGDEAQSVDQKSARERAADEFASEFLIKTSEFKNFVARVKPLYAKAKITGFANRIGVHPGIVVGRLQFMREINYSHSREMLAKVRSIVTQAALTDGWGNNVPTPVQGEQSR